MDHNLAEGSDPPLQSPDETHRADLERLIASSPDAVIVVRYDGTIEFANAAAGQILERTASALVGTQFGFSVKAGHSTEIEMIHGSTVRRGELRVTPLHWRGAPAILASIRDVTDARNYEESLRQIHKMEALSQLAGSLSHDLNNMLFVIRAAAHLLEAEEHRENRQRLSAQVLSAADSAANLVQQLLDGSRPLPMQLSNVVIDELIGEIRPVLQHILGDDTVLSLDLEAGEASIEADRSQVRQVLLNLILNSRDALPVGGRVTIRTEEVGREEIAAQPLVAGATVAAHRYVRVDIGDSGAGMSPETVDQVFEPFFTTKSPDQGTGLGLATAWTTVHHSGGHIEVESELGVGSTFRIYLPISPTDTAT